MSEFAPGRPAGLRDAERGECALLGFSSYFRVTAGSFHPKPKVDAEVLIMRPRVPAPFADNEEGAVIETVRVAFSSRRKTLRNALSSGLSCFRARRAALEWAAIHPGARLRPSRLPISSASREALAARTGDAELPRSNRCGGLCRLGHRPDDRRRPKSLSRGDDEGLARFEAAIAGRRIEALARRRST